MSRSWGEAARRLSGQAALLLGWNPPQFWNSTPAELAAVLAALAPPPGEGVDRNLVNAMLERERHG